MKFEFGNGDKPLDGYIIKRGVGVGGFGEVYFAESESGKEVALKRIQKNLEVEVRGVKHCLNLRHPNLVGIYDIRFDRDEQGWIVMEYISGESLRDRIDRHSSSSDLQESIGIFAQLVAGVVYLHDQGIVHRDLKPANIFIEQGLVKIGDYGLSKYISVSRRGGQTESVGTFHYMAPEIGKGEYGQEVDIYALGIILYEMLTGVVPFDGESCQEIILKHLTAAPDLSMIEQPYRAAIHKALLKDPTQRFRNGRDFLAAIGWEIDRSGMASKAATAEPLNRGSGVSPEFAKYTSGETPEPRPEEPIAKGVKELIDRFRAYLGSLPPGHRGLACIAFAIAGTVAFVWGGWAILTVCLIAYYCAYYPLYVAFGPFWEDPQPVPATPKQQLPQVHQLVKKQSRDTQPPPPSPPPVLPVVRTKQCCPVERFKNCSVTPKEANKEWKVAERLKRSEEPFWTKLHTFTQPWARSGLLLGVVAVIVGAILQSTPNGRGVELAGSVVWISVMAWLTTWTILYFSRIWETKREDVLTQRFILLGCGAVLGIGSSYLSDYLHLPWDELAQTRHFGGGAGLARAFERTGVQLYGENRVPLLPVHIGFFAALLFLVRWWRQSDFLRKRRFSLFGVAAAVGAGAIVQIFLPFLGGWALILAGAISVALQLSSPWKSYDA